MASATTPRASPRVPPWLSRLALLAIAIAWAVFLRPMSLGGPVDYLVIRGDSMLPTYRTGDLVLVQAADRYASGDVVAYRVPAGELGAGRLVIHRVVDLTEADAAPTSEAFVMRGDNNPAPDPWHPTAADIVGRAWLAIPELGRVLAFMRQPAFLGALAVAVLVVGWFLRSGPRREG